jgi:hypothetical protein
MVHLLSLPPGSPALAARVLELLVAERRGHEERQVTSLRQYTGDAHAKLDEAPKTARLLPFTHTNGLSPRS